MDNNRYCIIMAGGIGSRFWPISRRSQPKQFLDILDTGKSFIRHTYERFAKIIPPEKSGEYFGLMDICGKGASFLGTTVISLISQVTGKVNIGVGAISLFFVLGMIVFRMATAEEKGEGKKVRMRFGEDGVS